MAGKIEKAGQGFLDQSGNVKSRETLAREEAQAAKKVGTPGKDEGASKSVVGTALERVETEFNRKANSLLDRINKQDENVRRSKKLVDEEIKAAEDLKTAIQANDTAKADASRQKLAELEKERVELSDRIEETNRDVRSNSGVLSFGNQVKGSVRVSELPVRRRAEESSDLNSAEGAQRLSDRLRTEREGLDREAEKLGDQRKSAGSIFKEVDRQLSQISQDSIRDEERATLSADKLASAIRSSGPSAIFAQSVSDAVSRLLS